MNGYGTHLDARGPERAIEGLVFETVEWTAL